jgi:hypothetical protein
LTPEKYYQDVLPAYQSLLLPSSLLTSSLLLPSLLFPSFA